MILLPPEPPPPWPVPSPSLTNPHSPHPVTYSPNNLTRTTPKFNECGVLPHLSGREPHSLTFVGPGSGRCPAGAGSSAGPLPREGARLDKFTDHEGDERDPG